jgi:predicted metal-dependent hydrolase
VEFPVQDIVIRQMDFGFPESLDPIVIEGQPEASYRVLGLSLLLPFLEPYLIRTMKEARKHVRDPELAEELRKFSGQEGQHYKQHIRFNDAFRSFGFDRLPEFEAELEADYQRFSGTKSLRFNLAYAEGFEALTTAVAQVSFERGGEPGMNEAARDLFAWHMIEELEHRTVAFDVYDHLFGSYAYRLFVGAWAQWHMARWITRVGHYMLESDPRALADYGGTEGRRERERSEAQRLRRTVLPRLLRTYLPWYTPHAIPFTDEMKAMAQMYSEIAIRRS